MLMGRKLTRRGSSDLGFSLVKDPVHVEKLVLAVKSDSPSILTREETDGLDSLTFENVGARFFASLLDQLSLQLFWSFSSFSFGLVGFFGIYSIYVKFQYPRFELDIFYMNFVFKKKKLFQCLRINYVVWKLSVSIFCLFPCFCESTTSQNILSIAICAFYRFSKYS